MTGVLRSGALRHSTLRLAAVVFVTSLTTPVASGKSEDNRAEPRRGGRLVVGVRTEVKHFNPLTALDQPTRTVHSLLHADLLRIDRTDLETYPNVASEWHVSDDGRTYTITLRDGVRFSDGHPLSVDDVVFSFRAYLDERVSSPQRDLLVVGGEPIRVTKLDERRVAFTLTSPYAAGERLFDSFHVLPEHILGDWLDRGEGAGAWGLLSEPKQLVGLGPFRVKQVVPGERVVLERNPHYFKVDASSRSLPYLDEVVFVLTSTEEAELLRFKAGDVHVIERLSAHNFDALAADAAGFQMLDLGPGLEYHFFLFNLNDTPAPKRWLDNVAFRRALAAAIDKQAIVELVFGGRATPLATHVTLGNSFWLNRELGVGHYSVAAAKRGLRDAGFRWDGEGNLVDDTGTRVVLSVLTNAGNRNRALMASLIQADLERVGIRVRIATLEFRAYVERIFDARDYDTALMALVSGDTDPNPQLSVLMSDGATHVWRLGEGAPHTPWEAEIDRLMQQQLITLDAQQRKALYDRVQAIMLEYQPIVGLASPHILVGADKDLRNFRPGIVPPYTLWNADELFFEGGASAVDAVSR
jgi:peptide/nickel transport system substrate-binding protein